MKRVTKDNKNTAGYWDSVYKDLRFDGADTYAHISNHIQDDAVSVIDLGCGDGRGLEVVKNKLKNDKIQYIGVDFSETAIKYAKENFWWGKWFAKDATATELPDEICDYVISSETLEHLEEPHKLLEEANRLLVDNGKLILTTPWRNHIPSDEHLWAFEYQDVERMVREAGFRSFWVFPLASGRQVHVRDTGEVVFPAGHWDQIMALAIK